MNFVRQVLICCILIRQGAGGAARAINAGLIFTWKGKRADWSRITSSWIKLLASAAYLLRRRETAACSGQESWFYSACNAYYEILSYCQQYLWEEWHTPLGFKVGSLDEGELSEECQFTTQTNWSNLGSDENVCDDRWSALEQGTCLFQWNHLQVGVNHQTFILSQIISTQRGKKPLISLIYHRKTQWPSNDVAVTEHGRWYDLLHGRE